MHGYFPRLFVIDRHTGSVSDIAMKYRDKIELIALILIAVSRRNVGAVHIMYKCIFIVYADEKICFNFN